MAMMKLINTQQVLNLLLRDWKREPHTKVLIFTKSVKLLDMLDYHLSNSGERISP
jgi:SNF2 family DNA or RNA helicase